MSRGGRRLLSTGALARALGMHVRTMQRWCVDGVFPAAQVNGRWYVRASDFEAWLDALGGAGGEAREKKPDTAALAGTRRRSGRRAG